MAMVLAPYAMHEQDRTGLALCLTPLCRELTENRSTGPSVALRLQFPLSVRDCGPVHQRGVYQLPRISAEWVGVGGYELSQKDTRKPFRGVDPERSACHAAPEV